MSSTRHLHGQLLQRLPLDKVHSTNIGLVALPLLLWEALNAFWWHFVKSSSVKKWKVLMMKTTVVGITLSPVDFGLTDLGVLGGDLCHDESPTAGGLPFNKTGCELRW